MNTSRLSRYVPAAAIAVVGAAAGWVATRSLQQDLAAYWVAGAARRAGLDPYLNHVGVPGLWDGVASFNHSRFLYPPLVAELFRALAALPYALAKVVFTALAVAAWIAASLGSARAAGSRLAVTLGAGALAYPLYLHLERGQVDVFLLLLLLVAFSPRARVWAAGPALAAAIAVKPTLLALVPVLAALGRWRVVGSALAGVVVVALVTVAVSGPTLTRAYLTEVVPRVALFGEGGNESMTLPAARLAPHEPALETGVARLDGRDYPIAAWDARASASLPRLLAPEGPTKLAARGPALVLFAALVGAALVVRRRRLPRASAALLLWAAAVACVVASPAGWLMGFVWALPLAPWLARLRGASPPRAWWALALAGTAVACPPLTPTWAALAGTAVVVAATALALCLPPRALEPA